MLQYESIGELFRDLVPDYKGRSYRFLVARFGWDETIVDFMERLSPRRCATRLASYLIPGELDRAAANASSPAGSSLRFGFEKSGQGFVDGRKDFCLVGGTYRKKHLTLFYRRLELLGGLFPDMVIVREIERALGPVSSVTVMAVQADVYARDGGSNHKLFNALVAHFKDQ